MPRLIKADKLRKDVLDLPNCYNGFSDTYDKAMIIDLIDEQPTVEAEPVRHGKWIMKSDPFGFFDEIPVCSECGCTTKMREKTKFCPNCGAKMDEEKENE